MRPGRALGGIVTSISCRCTHPVAANMNKQRLAISAQKHYTLLHHLQKEPSYRMSEHTALLIIDMQIDSFEVPGNPTYREAELLDNIGELLRKAHAAGIPVIYIQHQEKSGSLVPGTRGWHILP